MLKRLNYSKLLIAGPQKKAKDKVQSLAVARLKDEF